MVVPACLPARLPACLPCLSRHTHLQPHLLFLGVPVLPPLQGRHVDRLMTISYLPVNLVVIAAMVHFHLRVRPRLRILGGLLGFTLSISAVPLVRAVTERSPHK